MCRGTFGTMVNPALATVELSVVNNKDVSSPAHLVNEITD